MPDLPILVPLGFAIIGVAGLLGFSFGFGAGSEEDGILDDLGDVIGEGAEAMEATARTIGALTALVLAGGAVFIGTRLVKG